MIHKPLRAQLTNNFHSDEFACHEALIKDVPGYYTNNMVYLATQLQKIRDVLGSEIRINSAYRTKNWNSNVGGSKNSNHLTCMAADIVQPLYTNDSFYNLIKHLISIGAIPDGELLKYESFIHYSPQFDWKHLPIRNLFSNEVLTTYDIERQNNLYKHVKFNSTKILIKK